MRFGIVFAIALAAVQERQVRGWVNPTVGGKASRHSVTSLEMVSSIRKTAQRVADSVTNKERSREDLKIGIAGFYDRSSQLWEDVWGEHMHHGKLCDTPTRENQEYLRHGTQDTQICALLLSHTHIRILRTRGSHGPSASTN